MPNWIYDGTAGSYGNLTGNQFPKSDFIPVPGTANFAQYLNAFDTNTIIQALTDIRSAWNGSKYYGLSPQAVDPAPTGLGGIGQPGYLWFYSVDSSFRLTMNGAVRIFGGGGWITAADIDFSLDPNQTLNSDGNYSIGGLTWKYENSTNANVATAVTNGTGLIIQPKSTGDYSGTARTAPLLHLPFTNLPGFGSGWDITTPIRVWYYVTAQNAAANSDNSFIAIDNDAQSQYSEVMFRGFNTGVGAMTLRHIFITGVTDIPNNETLGSSNVVSMVVLRGGVGDLLQGFYGAIGGGGAWPTVSSLQAIGQIAPGNAIFTTDNTRTGTNMDFSTLGLTIGAMRAGSGTSYSVTIKKIRVDYIVD